MKIIAATRGSRKRINPLFLRFVGFVILFGCLAILPFLFSDVSHTPHHRRHVAATMVNTPPGTYRRACRKCHFVNTTIWKCTCKPHSSNSKGFRVGTEQTSMWPLSHQCLSLGTLNGMLYCEDWKNDGLTLPIMSYVSSCNQCHLTTALMLYCRCRHEGVGWKATAIAVRDECVDIGNHNGTLTCRIKEVHIAPAVASARRLVDAAALMPGKDW